MATSTLDSLNELTSSVKTDMVLVQDDPSGSPEDKKETINNLLATPVDKTMLVLGSEPAGNPPAGFVYRWASSADKKTYIKDSDGNVTLEAGGLGAGSNQLFEGRITPTTGVPVELSDQTSITELFITPFEGNQVRIYDGSNWQIHTFSEITVKITNTLTSCAYSSGSAVITVPDSSDLLVGMVTSGTGIPAGAVISTIDSATQVTLDQNTTSTVPGGSVDFKIPASSAVDLFLYSDSGTVKCKQVMWTNTSTRATALTTQDGIDVLTGDTGMLYIGSYKTTTTAGETSFSNAAKQRLIWNRYNQKEFPLLMTQALTYALTSTSPVEENGTGNARVEVMYGKAQRVRVRASGACANNVAGNSYIVGVGIDTVSANSAQILHPGYCSGAGSNYFDSLGEAIYDGVVAAGYHYFADIAQYSLVAGNSRVTVLRPSLELQAGGFVG